MFQLLTASVDQSDIPLCDVLALKPPYTETRSLRSTVSGTSIAMFRLGDDDRSDKVAIFGSADSA